MESYEVLINSIRELIELVYELILNGKASSMKFMFLFLFNLPEEGIATSLFFELPISHLLSLAQCSTISVMSPESSALWAFTVRIAHVNPDVPDAKIDCVSSLTLTTGMVIPLNMVILSGKSLPASPAGVRQRVRKVFTRELLLSVALGQVLSLLICGIGLTSKYLSEDFHANTPVFQSFLNYILLFLVYTTTLAVRQGEENLLAILKRRWWKYMILGIIDIEANYLVVKAYQYTTLTSVQLLDCFVIPVVILLSWFFLLVRYKAVHFIGIVVCILGMGCMAGADVLVGRQQGAGENKLIGDLLVLGGATLYGISNVCEEYIVRNLSRVEFLGMIGLFGSFFSGIQLAIMEHKELLKVPWDWQIGLLYVGFSACMFGLYSFMPVVIKKTSATAVNLSLLTADLYSLFCGLFLFHYKFSGLYLLSFFTILVGLVLYSSTSTYVAQDPRVYKQFRNPSGPVVDLPAPGQLEPSVTYTSLGQETEEEPHVRVA
ncbi:PREDICTED: solute carrier family 35 member F1 [Crocodylus porosus]|uniref:solute carrier family 35 member F1 n=3 Tax=Archosauria TaxID=8492 RepID=UPI00093BFFC0|nr:PREDICTED: solute carrier family 35 member F1 [Crocodylus porosus]